jgi:hypothetical protein
MIMRLLAVAVLVLAGCADTPNGGGTPAPTTASETTGEPSPEPTTPETTQTKQNKPSISIATAPVGGAPDSIDVEQCASVSWLGDEIPAGATIRLGEPQLSPRGIFRLDQSICSGRRACPGVVWDSDNQPPCSVGARQIKNVDRSVSVVIPAFATCESAEDCADLRARAKEKGTQVTFTAVKRETPTTEPTSNGTPTDDPSNGTPSNG